jgi:hypothetical protein
MSMFGVFEAITKHQAALDKDMATVGTYRLCTVHETNGLWHWSNNPGRPGLFECMPLLIQQKVAVLRLLPPRVSVGGIGWYNGNHYFLHMNEPEEEWDKPLC